MNPADNRAREDPCARTLSDLQELHRQLLDDPDINTCLEALGRLPKVLQQLSRAPLDDPHLREQISRLLSLLADSLTLADAHLRNAQLSLRSELQELSSQQEWVRTSRQIT